MVRVPAVIMRGGTSRAVFFHRHDLPADPRLRDAFVLAAFGSPDPDRRQVDGLGGATSSTSKLAVIGPAAEHDVDVLYDFGQVSIDKPLIDRRGNCGNISSAVGPFAVDEGMVAPTDPVTPVRFLNVNTDKQIVAHVPTRDGRFDPTGSFEVPGVPGTGAAIRLDYLDPAGAVTGSLLPTGRVRDDVDVPGVGQVSLSLVDAANPAAFIGWDAVGLTGTESPDQIDADPALLSRIEAVRGAAAVLAGITRTPEQATAETPSVPKLVFVGPPRDYALGSGEVQPASGTTLRAAMMSMGRLHRSYALTGAICTTVAGAVPGTVVADAAGGPSSECRIGHPAGVMPMSADVTAAGDRWRVDSVSGYRTARRLMEGAVLVPDEALTAPRRDHQGNESEEAHR